MEKSRRPFRPNSTPTPNEIYDSLMAKMPGDKLKVVLAVVRKTYGWHKDTDRIANCQFEELTGLPKRNIQKFKAELIAEGIIGKIPGPKGGIDEYYFLGLGDAADCMGGVQQTAPGDAAHCTGGMQPTTPTKETNKRNSTKDNNAGKLPAAHYREICDIFAKGYQKLESARLTWTGKEKAFGNAVKTIIGQAIESTGADQWGDEILAEVRKRAAALYRDIEANRQAKLRGGKYNEFIARMKFTPLTMTAQWNNYPTSTPQAAGVVLPEAKISEEELRKHREASGWQ
ncbi:MAG TPA: replication protein [Turneriella sp.]|nr:replication protein [Turneriella sp.]